MIKTGQGLPTNVHDAFLPRGGDEAMSQVGWLGRTGAVYSLGDQPTDGWREPGGFRPLYVQVGTWFEIDPGVWVIQD